MLSALGRSKWTRPLAPREMIGQATLQDIYYMKFKRRYSNPKVDSIVCDEILLLSRSFKSNIIILDLL